MPIVYGSINENGGIVQNSGEIISAERTDKGRFSVTFKAGAFKSTPVAVATVMPTDQECGEEGTNRTISVTDSAPTQLCFGIRKASADDSSSDRPFNFVAIGN